MWRWRPERCVWVQSSNRWANSSNQSWIAQRHGWLCHRTWKIILSFGFNLLGVPGKMRLPYEVCIGEQITQEDTTATSRHFPVIVWTSWSEASREFHLFQSCSDITQCWTCHSSKNMRWCLFGPFLAPLLFFFQGEKNVKLKFGPTRRNSSVYILCPRPKYLSFEMATWLSDQLDKVSF